MKHWLLLAILIIYTCISVTKMIRKYRSAWAGQILWLLQCPSMHILIIEYACSIWNHVISCTECRTRAQSMVKHLNSSPNRTEDIVCSILRCLLMCSNSKKNRNQRERITYNTYLQDAQNIPIIAVDMFHVFFLYCFNTIIFFLSPYDKCMCDFNTANCR